MKKAKTTKSKVLKVKKDGDLPVTKRMLDLHIQEVKSDVTSLRLEMRAGFTNVDARFKEQDAKFLAIDARFESMESKLTKMMILLEDQNDRNKAALDGYITIYEKLVEQKLITAN